MRWGQGLAAAAAGGLLLALGMVPVPGAKAEARRIEAFTVPSERGPDYAVWISMPSDTSGPVSIAYVLDGNRFFAPLLNHVGDPLAPRTTRSAVLVGIGYATADSPVIDRRRMEDFSTPADIHRLSDAIQAMAPQLGGLDAFLERLEREIMPQVDALFPEGVRCRVVGGHSMGGLAALHAYFDEWPFDAYVAVSPSIFWNESEVLRRELPQGDMARSLRLYVGGEEQTDDAEAPPDVVARQQRFRMVDNAFDLARRLNAGRPGLAAVEVIPAATHDSVALAALERGLDATLADCAD